MTDNPNLAPPYMGYGTFEKSIETLSATVVPTGAIDRRVLSEFSGADYGSLMSGLRFLGLVDGGRKATSVYRDLVGSWNDKAKFKEYLKTILIDKYAPVIGHLDLDSGTSADLEKAFKDFGVTQGQMLTKSIRFFLKAFAETGMTLSPHMTAAKPRAQRNASGKKDGKTKDTLEANSGSGGTTPQPDAPTLGYERLALPGMPNCFIQYPTNLTEAHCQILEAMVGVLRTSVLARTGTKEKAP